MHSNFLHIHRSANVGADSVDVNRGAFKNIFVLGTPYFPKKYIEE